jgi:hypothetical protein
VSCRAHDLLEEWVATLRPLDEAASSRSLEPWSLGELCPMQPLARTRVGAEDQAQAAVDREPGAQERP